MKASVPSGDLANAGVSDRCGSAVTEYFSRLKTKDAEPKKPTKESRPGGGQISRCFRFRTGGLVPQTYLRNSGNIFLCGPTPQKIAAKFGVGG